MTRQIKSVGNSLPGIVWDPKAQEKNSFNFVASDQNNLMEGFLIDIRDAVGQHGTSGYVLLEVNPDNTIKGIRHAWGDKVLDDCMDEVVKNYGLNRLVVLKYVGKRLNKGLPAGTPWSKNNSYHMWDVGVDESVPQYTGDTSSLLRGQPAQNQQPGQQQFAQQNPVQNQVQQMTQNPVQNQQQQVQGQNQNFNQGTQQQGQQQVQQPVQNQQQQNPFPQQNQQQQNPFPQQNQQPVQQNTGQPFQQQQQNPVQQNQNPVQQQQVQNTVPVQNPVQQQVQQPVQNQQQNNQQQNVMPQGQGIQPNTAFLNNGANGSGLPF